MRQFVYLLFTYLIAIANITRNGTYGNSLFRVVGYDDDGLYPFKLVMALIYWNILFNTLT